QVLGAAARWHGDGVESGDGEGMVRRWRGVGGIRWRRRGVEVVVGAGGEPLRGRLLQFESEEVDLQWWSSIRRQHSSNRRGGGRFEE
ncbi:unnamed protein product, partial [Urochloa humidicola]